MVRTRSSANSRRSTASLNGDDPRNDRENRNRRSSATARRGRNTENLKTRPTRSVSPGIRVVGSQGSPQNVSPPPAEPVGRVEGPPVLSSPNQPERQIFQQDTGAPANQVPPPPGYHNPQFGPLVPVNDARGPANNPVNWQMVPAMPHPYWNPMGPSTGPMMYPNGPVVQFPSPSFVNSCASVTDVACVGANGNWQRLHPGMGTGPIDSGPRPSPTPHYMTLELASQTLQKFDGSNISAKEFIEDCRYIYNKIHPSHQDTFVLMMKKNITGEARLYLQFSASELSFQRIVESLERAYRPKTTLDGLMAKLDELRQNGREEGVLKFFNRTKELLGQVLDACSRECSGEEHVIMTARGNKRATYCFIRGLNRNIGDDIRAKNPATLEEALDLALGREQYLTEQFGLRPYKNSPRQPDNVTPTNVGSNAPITVVERAQVYTAIKTGKKRRLCFMCESPDHRKDNCPYKTSTERYYCTHCKSTKHMASHCFNLHGSEKVKALIADEKKARMARNDSAKTKKSAAKGLNGQSAPGNSGTKSAVIVIPPPAQNVSSTASE